MSRSDAVLSCLKFASRFWLTTLKRAIYIALISFAVTSVKLSLSQFESGSGEPELNHVNLTNSSVLCPINASCSDLPGRCLECDFDENCNYTDTINVTCSPIDTVECLGERNFSKSFVCQYCYQLQEEQYCCPPNTTCSVRDTPTSLYTANCTANDEVLCLRAHDPEGRALQALMGSWYNVHLNLLSNQNNFSFTRQGVEAPRDFQKRIRCNYSSGFRWSTTFLLSITLGGFGVDRFYLHHWASACGKLISFGGLGVWSILDVVLVGAGYLAPADGSAYVF